jgi:hypothetical protein
MIIKINSHSVIHPRDASRGSTRLWQRQRLVPVGQHVLRVCLAHVDHRLERLAPGTLQVRHDSLWIIATERDARGGETRRRRLLSIYTGVVWSVIGW